MNLLLVLLEAAQDGIGDLAVHFDVPVAGKGEGVGRFGGAGAGEMGVMGIMGVMRVRRANRAGVAERAAEDVGGEVREGPTSNSQHPTAKAEKPGFVEKTLFAKSEVVGSELA
jgi:hypothetical protein